MDKYEALKKYLKELGSVAVAYSAGVDSTFLLYAAREALGENLLALTANSCFFPEEESETAKNFCIDLRIRQVIVSEDVLSVPGIKENPAERCYLCKKAIFSSFQEEAKKAGISYVVEGSNVDDEGDYRPGLLAISELGIKSPLRHVGYTKAEIRQKSRELGLPTWQKPSFACLASRFPYGEVLTEEKLSMVEQGERLLKELGFSQYRVRVQGLNNQGQNRNVQSPDKNVYGPDRNVLLSARIEILPEEFSKIMETNVREKICVEFQKIGFVYTALDLTGYRTGSLNVGV